MNQILSQDEINALLRGISDGEIEGGQTQEPGSDGIRKYDLASQERSIRGRMPTMELVNDRFARSFRTVISKFLGRSCFVNIGATEVIKFGLFMKKLPLPSSLHVYRMPPLKGHGLLVLSTPLVFNIIDLLFGGKGGSKVKIEGREYTPIETRIISKAAKLALETFKDAWAPVHPIDFVYDRSEFNPIAVAIVPPTEVVITTTIEIELEQESTSLTFCIPYSSLEPIRHKMSTSVQVTQLERDATITRRIQQCIKQAKVNLSIELARGTITAGKLSTLQVGDILPLETSPTEEAILRVQGVPKFRCYVGSFRGCRAAKVSREIERRSYS